MQKTIEMIAAPVALSPGGYVAEAYKDRNAPGTPTVNLEARRKGAVWSVRLDWSCAEPVREIGAEVDRFVDAAALLAPVSAAAPLMTMGAPEQPVEGVFWRAHKDKPQFITAQGLGSVESQQSPGSFRVNASWSAGRWLVEFDLEGWAALDASSRIGIAVWQGIESERGGLKSVSPNWLELG